MSSELSFCPECNNLLYPKEDKGQKQLMFLCRQCEHASFADPTNAEENCVDRINFNYRSKEDILVSKDLAKDPTLGRTYDWNCQICGFTQAVFFQLPERISDDAMTLVFVCCNESCGHWEKQGKDDQEPVQRSGLGGSQRPPLEEVEGDEEEAQRRAFAFDSASIGDVGMHLHDSSHPHGETDAEDEIDKAIDDGDGQDDAALFGEERVEEFSPFDEMLTTDGISEVKPEDF